MLFFKFDNYQMINMDVNKLLGPAPQPYFSSNIFWCFLPCQIIIFLAYFQLITVASYQFLTNFRTFQKIDTSQKRNNVFNIRNISIYFFKLYKKPLHQRKCVLSRHLFSLSCRCDFPAYLLIIPISGLDADACCSRKAI